MAWPALPLQPLQSEQADDVASHGRIAHDRGPEMSALEMLYSLGGNEYRAWRQQAEFHNPRVLFVSDTRCMLAYDAGYDALDFAETC